VDIVCARVDHAIYSHDVHSDQVQAQRALEVTNRYTPIPRPRMTKNITWSMARLEEILGLPHRKAKDPVGKARGVIYNWAQVSLFRKSHWWITMHV
jgi:hypothetical protein